MYFSIPKEYILFQHIFFSSLTNKKSFIFSQKRLWRYTYISVSLFHTHKESRHHLFISGEIWKSQDFKYSSSRNFETKNMFLFLPAFPFPEFFAFHSQLHGQLHGFCRILTNCNEQLHFLLFYSEQVCKFVFYFWFFLVVVVVFVSFFFFFLVFTSPTVLQAPQYAFDEVGCIWKWPRRLIIAHDNHSYLPSLEIPLEYVPLESHCPTLLVILPKPSQQFFLYLSWGSLRAFCLIR